MNISKESVKQFINKKSGPKALYISVHRDGTGYSNAAIDYILAMDKAGIDVVPRAVKLNGAQPELPNRLLELENQSSSNCSICIQHIIPNFFVYNGNFDRNIGVFACETDSLPIEWVRQCNLLDEIWTFGCEAKSAIINSGVEVPVDIVPHAHNLDKYKVDYGVAPFRQQYADDFVFIGIAEWNVRKNWESLIKSFHSEFRPYEPVQLLIKTHMQGVPPQKAAEIVNSACNEIKSKLRIFPNTSDYKSELIVTDYLDNNTLCQLEQSADCFVSASRGEGWCIPAVEMMGFGKEVILPDHTAYREYNPSDNISYQQSVCYGSQTLDGLNTANEYWYEVDECDLRAAMRRAFEDGRRNNEQNRKVVEQFSYENVGNRIKELLNEVAPS